MDQKGSLSPIHPDGRMSLNWRDRNRAKGRSRKHSTSHTPVKSRCVYAITATTPCYRSPCAPAWIAWTLNSTNPSITLLRRPRPAEAVTKLATFLQLLQPLSDHRRSGSAMRHHYLRSGAMARSPLAGNRGTTTLRLCLPSPPNSRAVVRLSLRLLVPRCEIRLPRG